MVFISDNHRKLPDVIVLQKYIPTVREGGWIFRRTRRLHDGEWASNTVWLKQKRNWTRLLTETDPYFYTQQLGKNRRVWHANVCLSPARSIITASNEFVDAQIDDGAASATLWCIRHANGSLPMQLLNLKRIIHTSRRGNVSL